MTKIQPVGAAVLVQERPVPVDPTGGDRTIEAGEGFGFGTVVSAGGARSEDDPMPGDAVVYRKDAGVEVRYAAEDAAYRILTPDGILAVIAV